MLEPVTLNATYLILASSLGIVYAVVSPIQYASSLAAVFVGLAGAAAWQAQTQHVRKPVPAVMWSDIVIGAFAGYTSKVVGAPTIVALLNRFVMPKETPIVFSPTEDIGWVIVFAGIAGLLSSPAFRWFLDWWKPGWDRENGREN